MTRLLARLHACGINAAIMAGLVLMPAVVAVGFLVDRHASPSMRGAGDLGLRGTFDSRSAPTRDGAAGLF